MYESMSGWVMEGSERLSKCMHEQIQGFEPIIHIHICTLNDSVVENLKQEVVL